MHEVLVPEVQCSTVDVGLTSGNKKTSLGYLQWLYLVYALLCVSMCARMLNSGGQFDQACNPFDGTILVRELC